MEESAGGRRIFALILSYKVSPVAEVSAPLDEFNWGFFVSGTSPKSGREMAGFVGVSFHSNHFLRSKLALVLRHCFMVVSLASYSLIASFLVCAIYTGDLRNIQQMIFKGDIRSRINSQLLKQYSFPALQCPAATEEAVERATTAKARPENFMMTGW